jgi:hypothetical protein
MQYDRGKLTDELTTWFGDRVQGYFITLNTKMRLHPPRNDVKTSNAFIRCGQQVRSVMEFLDEYCYGRNALKGKRLAKASVVEIGNPRSESRDDVDRGDLVHAHIVAAHNGDTDRDVGSVKRFLERKWALFYDISASEAFVNVKPIGELRNRVWYMTKQNAYVERNFGDCTLTLQ